MKLLTRFLFCSLALMTPLSAYCWIKVGQYELNPAQIAYIADFAGMYVKYDGEQDELVVCGNDDKPCTDIGTAGGIIIKTGKSAEEIKQMIAKDQGMAREDRAAKPRRSQAGYGSSRTKLSGAKAAYNSAQSAAESD